MTRMEFDKAITALKGKRNDALAQVRQMQSDVKENIAAKLRVINELRCDIQKMHQQRIMYGKERLELEKKWNDIIREFVAENSNATSNLAEAETLSIVWELRHRGFGGVISRTGDDGVETYDLDKTEWGNEGNDDKNSTA